MKEDSKKCKLEGFCKAAVDAECICDPGVLNVDVSFFRCLDWQ